VLPIIILTCPGKKETWWKVTCRAGEIKVVCATTTLAMGVNLPFKNVILSIDKIESATGDSKDAHLTSLTFTDIENMGGRAGRLNRRKKGRIRQSLFF